MLKEAMRSSFSRFICSATAIGVASFILTACAPDPYNLHSQAYHIEKVISGPAALERVDPVAHQSQFVLHEGNRIPNGGIFYQVFRLNDIEITPEFGNALLARKARYGEIFGLLTKGAIGEGADGRLVPRVSALELTNTEQRIIEAENRDRDYLVEAAMNAKQVPPYEIAVIRSVFAYARFQLLPEGVWVETEPGKWIVKGGQGYVRRVMGRTPVLLDSDESLAPGEAERMGQGEPVSTDPETWPEEETATVTDEAIIDEPVPYVIESPTTDTMEEPMPEIRSSDDASATEPAATRPSGGKAKSEPVMLDEPMPTVR